MGFGQSEQMQWMRLGTIVGLFLSEMQFKNEIGCLEHQRINIGSAERVLVCGWFNLPY
jgi:hypothetical protein